MSESLAAEFKRILLSGFYDRLNGKLLLGYTKPLMPVNATEQSRIMDCRQSACFHNLARDAKYDHLASFLCALLIRDSHCMDISLPEQSGLFTRDNLWVYHPPGEVNENLYVTDLSRALNKALQLNHEPLVFFLPDTVPKFLYKIMRCGKALQNPQKHHQLRAVL